MTATASDIAASFLGRCEDDKFHIIFFVRWCKKGTGLQKTLIRVDLEIVGAVFFRAAGVVYVGCALYGDIVFLELFRRENYDFCTGVVH